MNAGRYKRSTPHWLAAAWEAKKQETVNCVEAAIGALRKTKQRVTISSIRDTVRCMFNRSLSANTIKRNERAYQLYLDNRRAPKTSQIKNPCVLEFYAQLEPTQKAAAQARIARLRRQAKDDLIVRCLRLEEALKEAKAEGNRLREEIIRLSGATSRISASRIPSNGGITCTLNQWKESLH